MDFKIVRTIEDGVAASYSGTVSFGEVLSALAAKGVESYRVDYRAGSSTYYLGSGDFHIVGRKMPKVSIGDKFEVEGIVEAIRASQAGTIKYPEFVERSMTAGCVGYVVWIAGGHITYFGRRGEMHIERFISPPT